MRIPTFEFSFARALARAGAVGVLSLTLGFTGTLQAAAQNTGTVTGQVRDAATQAPMASAQVSLTGTGLGSLTTQAGRFIILNVPAGSYTLRVERIGFATIDRQITVAVGQTISEDFNLQAQALGLDEIIVTGTAGAARRREIGNSIAQVNLSEVDEPVVSVDALLQGRVTGATIMQSSGMAGSGAMIRLRGNVSVAMSNQPILYVDGVRVRSDAYAKNVPPIGYSGRSGNDVISPMNSIDPNDIERIEVIKGAAATTLYGTEAAAGVIQIFTKRGHTGQARWTAQIEQGFAREQAFGPDLSGGVAPSEAGVDGNGMLASGATPGFMFIDPWLRGNLPSCDLPTLAVNQPCDSGLLSDWGAWQQKYSLSVAGGGEGLRYFLSGSWEDDLGVLPNDLEEKFIVRGNFTFEPLDGLQLQWNSSYTNDNVFNTAAGNNAHGLTLNAYRRDRNYLNDESFEAIDPFNNQTINTQIDHLITGLTATYSPRANFTNRLTVGYDLSQQEARNVRPFGFIRAPSGILSDSRYEFSNLTFDYVGTLNFGITEDIRSSFSWGAQSVSSETQSTIAYGDNFPGPGEPTVSAAGNTLGFEERIRVVNAGFFFQDVIDFNNKYFLTLGLRVDGNSAFGQDLGLQAYPKVSGSWVVSDESFWNPDLGQLKLRAAWGQSGRAPGAFDAVRTFNPVGWGGQPAFFPANVGNAELGPERTSEIEFGADASFLDDRLSTEFTYYHQKTTDALFNVSQVPSNGFLGSQLENVGELKNTGIELSANYAVLQGERFAWDLGANVYTNNAEVTSLPDEVPEFSLGGSGWIVEKSKCEAEWAGTAYADNCGGVPLIRVDCITNADALADPIIERDCPQGPNLPTFTFGINSTVTLPGNVSLTARGEYQSGHFIELGAAQAARSRSVRWGGCFPEYYIEETQGRDALTAYQRGRCVQEFYQADFFIYPADFFKIRELTLQVPIPDRFVTFGDGASLTLSGRNIWRWVPDMPVFEPEMAGNTGFDTQVRAILEHVPPPAIYTMALRVTF